MRARTPMFGRINFGDLVKNSPIRQIKIPAKVSGNGQVRLTSVYVDRQVNRTIIQLGPLQSTLCWLLCSLINPLTTECTHRATLVTCYQLAQSVLNIGLCISKRGEIGEVGGFQHGRAIAIRFGVIRLVVRAQECYTLGGPGGMQMLKFRGYEIASETNFGPTRRFSEAKRQSFT